MASAVNLQTLSNQASQALTDLGAPGRAGSDLAWACFRLGAADMGRTIVRRLGTGQLDPNWPGSSATLGTSLRWRRCRSASARC